MDNDDAILAGEDDLLRAEDTDREPEAEPDTFEVELDGEVHTLPAALKGAFLRQADYTRKTQELAEHRRAADAERQTLADDRRRLHGAASDRALVAALDRQLADFAAIDWRSLSQADPQRAQALWANAQRTQELREGFVEALSHHETREEIRAAREAAAAMAQTGRTLAAEVEGWSPEVAAKLVQYAQAFGVTPEELAQVADPRLWKLLHRAWRADDAEQQAAQTEARTMRPAVQISGGGGAGSGGVRDELGTKEWMRRRNAQAAGGR